MKKRYIALILLTCFVLFMTAGCGIRNSFSPSTSQTIKLYFANKGNTGLGIEEREIQYKNASEKYKKTLEALIQGPQNTDRFETSINKNTKVLEVKAQEGGLTVNFSKEFGSFSGVLHEAAVISSVVDTLLQYDEIKKVKLMVEGRELMSPKGEPYGFMTFIKFETLDNTVEREITLYFADVQAMFVVPEKRVIMLKKDAPKEELIKAVLEALIKGPTSSDLYKTIPPEVLVKSVSLNGDLVSVDFSKEMYEKHSKGSAGEAMTIDSIVCTLTDIEGINRVLTTVEGEPMNIENVVVEEPLVRTKEMLKNQ